VQRAHAGVEATDTNWRTILIATIGKMRHIRLRVAAVYGAS
jgi:hypothetical protein